MSIFGSPAAAHFADWSVKYSTMVVPVWTAAFLPEVVGVLDGGVAVRHHQGVGRVHVRDEVHDLLAFWLDVELADDRVALVGLQRRDDAVEARVGPARPDPELGGDRVAELDLHTHRLLRGVVERQRRRTDVRAVGDLPVLRKRTRRNLDRGRRRGSVGTVGAAASGEDRCRGDHAAGQ
jgi:hypothetical protein